MGVDCLLLPRRSRNNFKISTMPMHFQGNFFTCFLSSFTGWRIPPNPPSYAPAAECIIIVKISKFFAPICTPSEYYFSFIRKKNFKYCDKTSHFIGTRLTKKRPYKRACYYDTIKSDLLQLSSQNVIHCNSIWLWRATKLCKFANGRKANLNLQAQD